MRILVHDYSGHPFQMQLSRALAARRHEVLHVHCASYQTGKGAVTRTDDDPDTLRIEAIQLGQTFDRYSIGRRLGQELEYGGRFNRWAGAVRPDVILSSNDPLFAKARAAAWCAHSRTPWVFWLQDVYSQAMAKYLGHRFGFAGPALGWFFGGIERSLLRHAAAVVAITDDFRPMLRSWGVPDQRCHVVENWAPLDELRPLPKDNAWARRHGLHDRLVFLYSGTLGLKHDPGLLVALAERFRADDRVRVVVVSEGRGRDWLAAETAARPLANLLLLPYQPYEQVPEMLGTADVLLALLEPDAGIFSVPSKVLTYLCAQRPIVAAMPRSNLATRTVERAGAGVVVDPGNRDRFIAAAEAFVGDADLRRSAGERARQYAERSFDIDAITDRFEDILARAARTNGSDGSRGTRA